MYYKILCQRMGEIHGINIIIEEELQEKIKAWANKLKITKGGTSDGS